MEDQIAITEQEFEFLIKLYAAVLDWKNARLSLQMLQSQGEPQEKVVEAQQHLLECERALSTASSSKIGQRMFMAVSQGLYSVGDVDQR